MLGNNVKLVASVTCADPTQSYKWRTANLLISAILLESQHFKALKPSPLTVSLTITLLRMDESLRNAAQQGNMDALYSSIERDAYVLDKIDVIPFVETPLHIAASAGHTEFAREIMRLKPSFAKKLNQNGYTPVHLALQNNQTQLVLHLLKVEKDLVRVPGKEGVTPLHYIAQTKNLDTENLDTENLDLLAKFLKICPESIEDVTIRGETALHIALKYNMFDAFRVLVGWLRRAYFRSDSFSEKELFDWQDVEGNTVLHIAVTKNQPQIVKLLLDGNWFFRVNVNAKNLRGFTALDILQSQTPIYNSEKIKNMLRRAGALSSCSLRPVKSHEAFFKSPVPCVEKYWVTLKFRQQMNMTTEVRSMFLVVLALFLTSTFQATLSPPGGVWQDNYNASSTDQFNSTIPFNSTVVPINVTTELSPAPQKPGKVASHKAGTVMMNRVTFLILFVINILCFVLSMFIVLFLLPVDYVSLLCLSPMMLLYFSYLISILTIEPE